MRSSALPEGVPVLARGRHRTPRRGACFMEFASFLAGERWSDHPACTHPLLALLARRVNDQISDAGRQELTPLIPTVVGRRGDDRTWLRLPLAVAASSILHVPEATQRALAAGLLRAVEVCADLGPEMALPGRQAEAALELVPDAVAWVERLLVHDRISARTFAARCSPTIVRCTVDGVAESGGPHRDTRLRTLLEVGISACPHEGTARVGAAPSVR